MRVMPLQMLKQVQLKERFMLMTHDSIGHLKTLYMSVLSLTGCVESELQLTTQRWKKKNRLAFEYESSLAHF